MGFDPTFRERRSSLLTFGGDSYSVIRQEIWRGTIPHPQLARKATASCGTSYRARVSGGQPCTRFHPISQAK